MLYLKNSLVNLTIIFFSLFFLTFATADDGNFIFPKKKIITIKSDEKKQDNVEISRKIISIDLPKKNPLRQNYTRQNKIKDIEKINEVIKKKEVVNSTSAKDLPKKKPNSQEKIKTQNK